MSQVKDALKLKLLKYITIKLKRLYTYLLAFILFLVFYTFSPGLSR